MTRWFVRPRRAGRRSTFSRHEADAPTSSGVRAVITEAFSRLDNARRRRAPACLSQSLPPTLRGTRAAQLTSLSGVAKRERGISTRLVVESRPTSSLFQVRKVVFWFELRFFNSLDRLISTIRSVAVEVYLRSCQTVAEGPRVVSRPADFGVSQVH